MSTKHPKKNPKGFAGARAVARARDRIVKSTLHAGMQVNGEELRTRIVSELTDDGLTALRKAIRGEAPFREPQSWAVRNWLEAARVIGAETNIAMLITNTIGVSPQEATEAVSLAQSVEGLDEHAVAAKAEDYLRRYLEKQGKRLVIVNARATADVVQ